jgi:hypothetical protein
VLVVSMNEELEIAEQTVGVIKGDCGLRNADCGFGKHRE